MTTSANGDQEPLMQMKIKKSDSGDQQRRWRRRSAKFTCRERLTRGMFHFRKIVVRYASYANPTEQPLQCHTTRSSSTLFTVATRTTTVTTRRSSMHLVRPGLLLSLAGALAFFLTSHLLLMPALLLRFLLDRSLHVCLVALPGFLSKHSLAVERHAARLGKVMSPEIASGFLGVRLPVIEETTFERSFAQRSLHTPSFGWLMLAGQILLAIKLFFSASSQMSLT